MKFLYLKGVDVLGPVEVKQLMQESWFSDDILVCPEDKAEQESAWKSAKDYPEFKASLEQEIFAAEQQKPLPPVEKATQVPAVAEEKQSAPVAPAAPATPENKETGNQNKMQDLPPLEDTKTESSIDLKKKPEDQIIHDVIEEEIPKVNAPIPSNDPQDHTFRIPTEGDDNLLEDLPSESIFDSNESEEKAPIVLGEENATPEETSEDNKSKTMDHTSPVEEPLPVQEMDQSAVNKHSFMEISNNKILSSSDGRVKKEKKNDLMFILSFIVITVVAVALCLAFFNKKKEMENTKNQAAAEQNIEEEPMIVEQEKFQNNPYGQEAQDDILPQQASAISPEEQTIDIVKNTMLKSKGKTIGEYFQNVYGENYQTSWSAKPFTEKIYIVEFFASQVRSEPFVYLFRVDIEQQKITGALNNITLDLIG